MSVAATRSAASHRALSIEELIDRREVNVVYQPLVDLYEREIVGYEALARGPKGSELERPDHLFEEAGRRGVTAELDWACQQAALEGALAAGLDGGRALFVNLEPGVLLRARPDELDRLLEHARTRFPVFIELTERALTDDLPGLLALVDRMRSLGVGVALDDVGADARSLALMPFLAPEVIKLDLTLVQRNPSSSIAEIAHAVGAEAERTGALVLAEGIETEAHLQTARALGARYGQGWLFGRPEQMTPPRASVRKPIDPPRRRPAAVSSSPYEIVTATRAVRRGNKRLLEALSLQIEARAGSLGASAVLLSAFQEARYFSSRAAERYASIAERAALVGALGMGLTEHPAAGVRGIALHATDSLREEWDVTVLSPHFAAAFVARDLGDHGADGERRFDFALTYDRDLAIHAARAMMERLASL